MTLATVSVCICVCGVIPGVLLGMVCVHQLETGEVPSFITMRGVCVCVCVCVCEREIKRVGWLRK